MPVQQGAQASAHSNADPLPQVVRAAWQRLNSLEKWGDIVVEERLSGGMLNHVYRCAQGESSFVLKVTPAMLGADPSGALPNA